jgi:hypothetical protein
MASSMASKVCRLALVLPVTAILVFLVDSSSQAGIQGSGFRRVSALARVSSFDSGIVIDGVRFDTSNAEIRIDQRPGAASELQAGQLVALEGEVSNTGEAVATKLAYASDVQGAVSELDDKEGTFLVLGQRVRVVDSTLFGDGIHPARIKGLRKHDAVAVSGFASASGELIASRVSLAAEPVVAQARGVVTGLDTAEHTFQINDLTVEYAGAAVEGSLANGAVATVRGAGSSAAATLLAAEVDVGTGILADAGVSAAVEGLITRFDSETEFEVGGQRVVAVGATQLELNGAALGVDQRVDVSGTFDSAGVLVADRIRIEPLSLAVIEGFVEAVSAAGRTLRLPDLEVTVSLDAILEDRAKHHVRDFQLSDLRVGDFVELRGLARGAGSFEAAVLQRENPPKRSNGADEQAQSPK